MSCFELRKFVFRCEICKAQEIIESIGEPDLPKDWIYRSVGPCGLTNYYKKVEVCPKCASEVGTMDTLYVDVKKDLKGILEKILGDWK